VIAARLEVFERRVGVDVERAEAICAVGHVVDAGPFVWGRDERRQVRAGFIERQSEVLGPSADEDKYSGTVTHGGGTAGRSEGSRSEGSTSRGGRLSFRGNADQLNLPPASKRN
jgi:hypothetical protein